MPCTISFYHLLVTATTQSIHMPTIAITIIAWIMAVPMIGIQDCFDYTSVSWMIAITIIAWMMDYLQKIAIPTIALQQFNSASELLSK